MRILLVLAILLAGCSAPEPVAESDEADRPCPGHFHVTLLVADANEILPYYDEDEGADDRDARAPVAGIHMHGDDGLIHIHPGQPTCYSTAAALFAVDVHILQRGAIQVGDDVRNGTVRVDVQLWGEDWQTWDLGDLQETVPDAARVLLMVNPPSQADIAALREQVPAVPEVYQP
ncbi:MAG: hypothetical protein ACPHID_04030 [Thermoplasmatota archaeon]